MVGLEADKYVNGSGVCAYQFQRAEMNLYYMNNFLQAQQSLQTWEEYETTFFNVTLSITPFIPFSLYFCYRLPGETQTAW